MSYNRRTGSYRTACEEGCAWRAGSTPDSGHCTLWPWMYVRWYRCVSLNSGPERYQGVERVERYVGAGLVVLLEGNLCDIRKRSVFSLHLSCCSYQKK